MGQHTPGPWVGYENSEEGKHIISEAYPQGVIICEHVHTESDVALIAAAPAMYEALKAIAGQQSPNRWGYDSAEIALDDEWRAQARAAIAQAEGKE